MKKAILILSAAAAASFSFGEGAVEQFNHLGYGTVSGKLQTLSMYRDYDNGVNAYSSTLGLTLNYVSPVIEGWSVGASYVGAGVLNSTGYPTGANPGEALLGNGRVSVLNEGYLNYNMVEIGLTNTSAYIGRRINNGEVFRADPFRQKSRSIEAIEVRSGDLANTRLAVGQAWEMSNWIDAGDQWKFRNFGEVFGETYDTDGVTWGEMVNTSIENLEVALFDAIAYDVANLIGTRVKYKLSDKTALLGYYRNETDIGKGADHNSNVFGLSVAQAVGDVQLEGGYFGVYGDSLDFQETTTGINHALGSSMMIYAQQFAGGANTLYLKAVTKIEKTSTKLYGLYNFTSQDTSKNTTSIRNGQELNLVVAQPVPKIDNLVVAFKAGIGYRDGIGSTPAMGDTLGTDTRLFITYTF